MRLLNAKNLQFTKDYSQSPPQYAILSHTWQADEVTYQEMLNITPDVRRKAGFAKISKFCSYVVAEGYDHCWIDTCCIDKRNPTELSEAINSMFRWYKESVICYAYLSDISYEQCRMTGNLKTCLASSRWFTRGWTLQELIAPNEVIFCSREWRQIAYRNEIADILGSITGVDQAVLRKSRDLRSLCMAEKMSWAANRETERIEDIAYCLIGIFDVNIPLIYGEGERAFMRLQHKIIESSDDHTIFAWDASACVRNYKPETWGSVCAPHPSCFPAGLERRHPADSIGNRMHHMFTNIGLLIHVPVILTNTGQTYMALDCYFHDQPGKLICSPVSPLIERDKRFRRDFLANTTLDQLEGSLCKVTDIYIRSGLTKSRIVPYASIYQLSTTTQLQHRWSTTDMERKNFPRRRSRVPGSWIFEIALMNFLPVMAIVSIDFFMAIHFLAPGWQSMNSKGMPLTWKILLLTSSFGSLISTLGEVSRLQPFVCRSCDRCNWWLRLRCGPPWLEKSQSSREQHELRVQLYDRLFQDFWLGASPVRDFNTSRVGSTFVENVSQAWHRMFVTPIRSFGFFSYEVLIWPGIALYILSKSTQPGLE